MKNSTLLIALFLLAAFSGLGQEFKAVITFVNNDTTGTQSLLYYNHDNLGQGKNKHSTGSAELAYQNAKERVKYIYISNGLGVTGHIYLKNQDTVNVTRQTGGRFSYSGSNSVEQKLVAELYNRDLISFQATKEYPYQITFEKLVPYIERKFIEAANYIDTYEKEHPDMDPEILHMIKTDTKLSILKVLPWKFIKEDYNEDHYRQMMQLIEPVIKTLNDETYRYGVYLNYFQWEYAQAAYMNLAREKNLAPGDTGFWEQMHKKIDFYQHLEPKMRDDVIYKTLCDLFSAKQWGSEDVSYFTEIYYSISQNTGRIAHIKALEGEIKNLKDIENNARQILKDSLIREQELYRLDGSVVSFGEILDSLKGQWVYIDMWATWCAPCRVEMNKVTPDLLKKSRTKTVFISIDHDKERWKEVSAKHYIYESLAEHYLLDNKNSPELMNRLSRGEITIPRYFLFDSLQTKFYRYVEKPTTFNLDYVR